MTAGKLVALMAVSFALLGIHGAQACPDCDAALRPSIFREGVSEEAKLRYAYLIDKDSNQSIQGQSSGRFTAPIYDVPVTFGGDYGALEKSRDAAYAKSQSKFDKSAVRERRAEWLPDPAIAAWLNCKKSCDRTGLTVLAVAADKKSAQLLLRWRPQAGAGALVVDGASSINGKLADRDRLIGNLAANASRMFQVDRVNPNGEMMFKVEGTTGPKRAEVFPEAPITISPILDAPVVVAVVLDVEEMKIVSATDGAAFPAIIRLQLAATNKNGTKASLADRTIALPGENSRVTKKMPKVAQTGINRYAVLDLGDKDETCEFVLQAWTEGGVTTDAHPAEFKVRLKKGAMGWEGEGGARIDESCELTKDVAVHADGRDKVELAPVCRLHLVKSDVVQSEFYGLRIPGFTKP
jgi:hypothetical protein